MSNIRDLVVGIDFTDIDVRNLLRVDDAMNEIEDSFRRMDGDINDAGRNFTRLGRNGGNAMDAIGGSADDAGNAIDDISDDASNTTRSLNTLGRTGESAINDVSNAIEDASQSINDLGDDGRRTSRGLNNSLDDVGDAIRHVESETADATDEIAGFGRRGSSAVDGVADASDNMRNHMRSATDAGSKGVGGLVVKFKDLAATIGALYVVDKVKDSFTDMVKSGIEFDGTMETSQAAWATLLHSADKAKKTVQDLQKLGAQTPFEFEGLDKAGKLLTMAGLGGKDLAKNLTKVGNAVSAIGGGQDTLEGVSTALFQMSAKGKVQAEEMQQLAERGLPVWDILAKKMGKSTGELMQMSQKGKLLAKNVVPMLVDAMGTQFAGSMDKQSKTYDGMMSTLSDNWKMMAGSLMQPLFKTIEKKLPEINKKINDFTNGLQKGGLMEGFKNVLSDDAFNKLSTAVDVAKKIFDGFAKTLSFIKDHFDLIISAVGGLVAAMTTMSIINTVRGWWVKYKETTFATTLATDGLKAAMATLFGPIGLIVAGIGLLVAAGIYLWKNWDTVKEKAGELWDKIVGLKDAAIGALEDKIDDIKDTLGEWKDKIIDIKDNAIQAIKDDIQAFTDMLENHKGTLITTASILTVIFGPALAKAGGQAVIAGGKIVGSFIASVVKTGIQAGINGAILTATFIGSMVKTGAQAVVTGAIVSAQFIGMLIRTGAQAVITGGILTGQFIMTLLRMTGQAIITSAVMTGQLIMSLISFAASGWRAAAAVGAQTAAMVIQKGAMVAGAAVTGIMTAAQWALNVAMDANPIGIIILLIAGLVAAGIALYKNWDKVKGAAAALWGWLKEKFAAIKDSIMNALQPIMDLFGGLMDKWHDFTHALSNFHMPKIGLPKWMGGKGLIQTDGSHANGLERVPYDGYIAELHKDEAVLTANQANAMRETGLLSNDGQLPSIEMPSTPVNNISVIPDISAPDINLPDGIGGNDGKKDGEPKNDISPTKNDISNYHTFAPSITVNVEGTKGDPDEVAQKAAEAARKEIEKFWDEMNMKI